MTGILLGYEIGTGAKIELPLHHLLVTGVTQLSGKTTTLDALISRSGLRAITFETKRGEAGFNRSMTHTIRPFFKEQTDWQHVQMLLEATMREKMKFERSWIIKTCKGTKTLKQVLANVETELEDARGLSESIYTNLKAYLEIVIPEIERTSFSSELKLHDGINIMNVSSLKDEVQSLVISSTLEEIYRKEKDVIIVIPEAWKFCPEGRGNPVKLIAEKLIRQGASIGVYLWFDSQDIAGMEKSLLKQVDNWVLGRQREINEVDHTLAQVPVSKKMKPKPEEIMNLSKGMFYACFDDQMRKVYVQPSWLPSDIAIKVAKGEIPVPKAKDYTKECEEDMTTEQVEALTEEIEKLKRENSRLQGELKNIRETPVKARSTPRIEKERVPEETKAVEEPKKVTAPVEKQGIYIMREQIERMKTDITEEILIRLQPTIEKLIVSTEQPKIEVSVDRPIVKTSDETIKGKIALLIHEGFFDAPRKAKELTTEVAARGWGKWSSGGSNVTMYHELTWLCSKGFLREEKGKEKGKTWKALAESKKRIKESD